VVLYYQEVDKKDKNSQLIKNEHENTERNTDGSGGGGLYEHNGISGQNQDVFTVWFVYYWILWRMLKKNAVYQNESEEYLDDKYKSKNRKTKVQDH
jgi:hypothetical protein